MERMVKIGMVQTECSNVPSQNMDHTVAQIRKLASEGAQVIVLQELFRSLYFCDIESWILNCLNISGATIDYTANCFV